MKENGKGLISHRAEGMSSECAHKKSNAFQNEMALYSLFAIRFDKNVAPLMEEMFRNVILSLDYCT